MLAQALVVFAMVVLPAAIHGPTERARIASVESRVAKAKLTLQDPAVILRGDLERSLATIDWRKEGIGAPFEILAVLKNAESSSGRDGSRVSCTVEVLLREPSGALLGTVSGSARGEDRPEARASLERDVLNAAAKSTSSSIPEAIRRARKARDGK